MKRIKIEVDAETFQRLELNTNAMERVCLAEFSKIGILNLVRYTNDDLELVFLLKK